MQIGLIGLGQMGLNLALNLKRSQYDVLIYDTNPVAIETIQRYGIKTATSLKNLAESLETKRIIWLTITTREGVDQTIHSIQPYLSVGDIVIDGGDSCYEDSIKRSKALEAFQIDFLDCGISGGTENELEGASITVGGNRFAFNYCEQLFKDIAGNHGYAYCGKSGSGHYTKMINKGKGFSNHSKVFAPGDGDRIQ